MPRNEKTIHYIYKTTCKVTGRYYIGMHSASKLEDGYLGSGKRLRHSIRKHGKSNHIREILELFDTREQLIEREKELITCDMIQDNNCMNLMSGGTGGLFSLEHVSKAGKIAGKKQQLRFSADTEYRTMILGVLKNNVANSHKNGNRTYGGFKGKNHSDETKRNISSLKLNTGMREANSQYGTCWITKDGVNKKIKKDELNNYLSYKWSEGRISTSPKKLSIDKINIIKKLYDELKSTLKVAKKLNIGKTTVIKYLK